MSEEKRAPGNWGITQEQFLWNLRNRRVTVMTVTGQAFAGTLIGTSMFTIVIRQDSGLDILFQKGSLVYVCPAPQQSQSEV
jgi:sRNA-binding regulator protein Hfq